MPAGSQLTDNRAHSYQGKQNPPFRHPGSASGPILLVMQTVTPTVEYFFLVSVITKLARLSLEAYINWFEYRRRKAGRTIGRVRQLMIGGVPADGVTTARLVIDRLSTVICAMQLIRRRCYQRPIFSVRRRANEQPKRPSN